MRRSQKATCMGAMVLCRHCLISEKACGTRRMKQPPQAAAESPGRTMPRRHTEQPRKRPRRDDDLRRRPPTKRGRPIILIVCEGEETEYRYFEAMRKRGSLISVSIEVVGSGRQSKYLVEKAMTCGSGDHGSLTLCHRKRSGVSLIVRQHITCA